MKREILTWTDSNKEVLCKKRNRKTEYMNIHTRFRNQRRKRRYGWNGMKMLRIRWAVGIRIADLGERMGLTGRDAARHRCQFLLRCIASMIRAAITVLR